MLYFAYGMNLNKNDMARRCPGAVPVGTARLENYRLTFRGGLSNVEAAKGEVVCGGLWDINKEHLNSLDCFEGYPNLYDRKKHEVFVPGVGKAKAIIYFMTQKTVKMSLPECPGPYAENIIKTGYKDFGLPMGQYKKAALATEKAAV